MLKSNCTFTVIVASYNYEIYIKKTLKSLLEQTLQDFQVIVVDDGSQDSSVNIIESFVQQAPNRFQLLTHPQNKNCGLPQTILLALKHARGDYIAFCEADDFWAKDHLEKLKEFILSRKVEVEFAVNETAVINYSKKYCYEEFVLHSNKILNELSGQNIFDLVIDGNAIPTFSSVCVKKELLLSCDFNPPLQQYLDFWLWRQILVHSPCFFIPNCITYWRKHNSSYNEKANVKDIRGFIKASNRILNQKSYYLKLLLMIRYLKLNLNFYFEQIKRRC